MKSKTPRTDAITSQYDQPPETVMVKSTILAEVEINLFYMTKNRDDLQTALTKALETIAKMTTAETP